MLVKFTGRSYAGRTFKLAMRCGPQSNALWRNQRIISFNLNTVAFCQGSVVQCSPSRVKFCGSRVAWATPLP